jgi:hypothetical protein
MGKGTAKPKKVVAAPVVNKGPKTKRTAEHLKEFQFKPKAPQASKGYAGG